MSATQQPSLAKGKMASATAYDEFIEFIVKSGGPEAVLAFRPSKATQDRAYELIYKEREGILNSQEAAELNHYVELDHLFAMAKIRARLLQDAL